MRTEGLQHVGEGVVVGGEDSCAAAGSGQHIGQVAALDGLHQEVEARCRLRRRQEGCLAALRAHTTHTVFTEFNCIFIYLATVTLTCVDARWETLSTTSNATHTASDG